MMLAVKTSDGPEVDHLGEMDMRRMMKTFAGQEVDHLDEEMDKRRGD